MLISRIEFIRQSSKRKVALLNLTIDDIIQIKEIKVIYNQEELTFVYPTAKDRQGREFILIRFRKKDVEIRIKQLLVLAYEKFSEQNCDHGIFLLNSPKDSIYQLELNDFRFCVKDDAEWERLSGQLYRVNGFTSILVYRLPDNNRSDIRATICVTWDDAIQLNNILLKQTICRTGKRLSVIWPGEEKQGVRYQLVVPAVDFVSIAQMLKQFYREKQFETELGWIWTRKEEICECTYLVNDYVSVPYMSKKQLEESKRSEMKEKIFQLLASYLKCGIPVHLSALKEIFERAGIYYKGNYRTLISQDLRFEIADRDYIQIAEDSRELLDEIIVSEDVQKLVKDKASKEKVSVEDISLEISESDREILLALYEKGCYREFLKHDIFVNSAPDRLGYDLLECAVNCARMCLDDVSGDGEITFNEFQKVLVTEKRASDLYRYKTSEIMSLGCSTCEER